MENNELFYICQDSVPSEDQESKNHPVKEGPAAVNVPNQNPDSGT